MSIIHTVYIKYVPYIYMRLSQVYRNAIGFFYINLIPSIFAELPNCSFFWIFYGCNLIDHM